MERNYTGKNKANKKSEIVQYIFSHKNAAKSEIAKALDLSMPTVLQNTKELIEQGILVEGQQYESTGGRRAKGLALNADAAYSVGMDITIDHLSFVLIDFTGHVLKHARKAKEFQNSFDYYRDLAEELSEFLRDTKIDQTRVQGLGVALPGIIDEETKILVKSHALNLAGASLKSLERFMPYEVHFENDANAAMIAEQEKMREDAIYLFIGSTVGGAFRTNGSVFRGANGKAGEFGHMILVPGGRECHCGKQGCVNPYCSAQALRKASGLSLDAFMKQLEEGSEHAVKIWDEYLEYLAIAVSNLRMIYDTDIVLGGDVGEYLESHMLELGKRTMKYNKVDSDFGYLKNSDCKGGAAAGAAMHFIYRYMDGIY